MRISDWSSDVCSSDLGSIEQRLVKTIKSIFDTHEEWVDLGKPTQMLNPSTIEKAEAKLNPVPAANRKPKKPVPVHTVHGAGAPKDGVPLSALSDFFLDQPPSPALKTKRRSPRAIS